VFKDDNSSFTLTLRQSYWNEYISSFQKKAEEIIARTLDLESALASRDALSKTVYSRLLDW
jgi:myosin heavy subunit